MRVAVFDFCDTIVNFQTADRFVYYAIEHSDDEKIRGRRKILDNIQKCRYIRRFDKATKGRYSLNKRIILWQLRGMNKSKMENLAEDYYRNEITQNLHKDILELITEYQKAGWLIYIASGGYDVYLRFFISDYSIDGCCCTRLKFVNNVFSGKMEGKDCMRREKVQMMNKALGDNVENTVAYSDSKSDIPLLLWADKGVVVSKEKHRAWVIDYGLEEYMLLNRRMEVRK